MFIKNTYICVPLWYANKNEIMLVISSREFRDKQALYFDRADHGEEILVQRGRNKSYKIIAISDEDTVIKKEDILVPDEELKNAITAEELLSGIEEDIKILFRKRRLINK